MHERPARISPGVGPSRCAMPRAPSLELCVLPNSGGQSLNRGGCDTWPLELCVLPNQGANHSRQLLEPTQLALYGAEGARTPDLCNANAALSQLSYSPREERIGKTLPIALSQKPRSLGAPLTQLKLTGEGGAGKRTTVTP